MKKRSGSSSPSRKRSTRSSSRTRVPEKKDADKKVSEKRSKSPLRPRSPGRRVGRTLKNSVKDTTPVQVTESIKSRVTELENSVSPSKSIEAVIRSSVTRFEELTSDFVSSVRRSKRLEREGSVSLNSSDTKNSALLDNNSHGTLRKPESSFLQFILPIIGSIATPAIVFVAELACNRESCAQIPQKLMTWRRLFDVEAFTWYFAYLALHIVLAGLPIGFKAKSSDPRNNFTYRQNGLPILVIMAAVIIGLQKYLNFPPMRFLDKIIPMSGAATVAALVLVGLLALKNIKRVDVQRPFGYKGTFTMALYTGDETNPRIGSWDFKTIMCRHFFLTTIIYDSLLIYKEANDKSSEQVNLNVVFICALQILFFLEHFLFERNLYSSYTVNNDGVGLMGCLSCFLHPFFIPLLPKYLFLTRTPFNIWGAAGFGTIFLFGLVISLISNHQKASFRRNSSSFSSSDVIQLRNSSLYKGGLWGYVRHPNYIGGIIANLACCAYALFVAPLHWVPILVLAVNLADHFFQMHRVETYCHSRHGSAWNIYCSQVKHKLVPKIY